MQENGSTDKIPNTRMVKFFANSLKMLWF